MGMGGQRTKDESSSTGRAAQSCDKKAAAMDMNADADVDVDGDGEIVQSKVTALGHQGQQLRSVQLSPRQQRQQLSASPANRQRSMAKSSRSEDEGNFRLRCVIAGQAKQIGTRTAGGLMLN
ncbi:GD22160 [Drosophila simulans]|uniref:GD22160 n=1 Tax=Drosophila simulans TaxID=7240 RepID=B4Q389_DROSI|nr:GD22160 [Drosophila simulans]